jgi:hypothetical protein
MDTIKIITQPYHLGYSTYFSPFEGKAGYGGPFVITTDGGAAAFGDNVLYKFSRSGKEVWQRTIKVPFTEMESQCVAEDTKGNLYVFMLSYDHKRYRGGSERVLAYGKTGNLLFDKTLGAYTLMNNPTVSYVKTLADGRIYMRGQVVTKKPIPDKDPEYQFWEGWINNKGLLTQKAGGVIDWSNQEWQKWFAPE